MTKTILLAWLGKIMKAYLEEIPVDWEKEVNSNEKLVEAIRDVRQSLRKLENEIVNLK